MKVMKKKIIAISCAATLLVVGIVGGTLAYLQDADSDVNVMTMGNVYIAQHEYERVKDDNGNWVASENTYTFGEDEYRGDKLQEYTQGQPIYPKVGDTKWDDRNGSQAASGNGSHQQPWGDVGAPGSNQLFDDSVKNVIDKFVFVENTGKSDAYFRTVIAIEDPEGVSVENPIMTNTNGNYRYVWEWLDERITVNGVRYRLGVATHTEVLEPKQVARPSLLQLYMKSECTNEDSALFGDTLDVLVVSQAVQSEGFEAMTDSEGNTIPAAEIALDEAFGNITATNNPWVGEMNSVTVASADEFKAAIEDGIASIIVTENIELDEIVTINGNMSILGDGEVTITGPAGDYPIKIKDAHDAEIMISGVKIEAGTMNSADRARGISIHESSNVKLTLSNVEINAHHYPLNIGADNENLEIYITNSVLSGYCAINSNSDDVKITIEDSVLNGINDYDNPSEYPQTNDFAVINTGAMKNNDITLIDTEVNAIQNGNATEYHFLAHDSSSTLTYDAECVFTNNGVEVDTPAKNPSGAAAD